MFWISPSCMHTREYASYFLNFGRIVLSGSREEQNVLVGVAPT